MSPLEPVEFDLRICDAHHHLWQAGRVLPSLQRVASADYVAEHLASDMAVTPQVVRTVFVECGMAYLEDGPDEQRSIGETGWAARQAERLPALAAIVAHVDLRLGERVAETIELHTDAGRGLLRGVRCATAFDPTGIRPPAHTPTEPDAMLSRRFVRGAAVVARHGLAFDAWLYPQQIPELTALAQKVPDLRIVLDHVGAPPAVGPFSSNWSDAFAAWDRDLAELATHPNVMIKLSGLGMLAGPGQDPYDSAEAPNLLGAAWRDPLMRAIDHFGPERCMFGSNFPLDRRAGPYSTVWQAFLLATRDFTVGERRDLFHDTAVRCYQLAP